MAQPATIHEAIRPLLEDPAIARASIGLVVADAHTGQVLCSERADAPAPPASVMKLVTSAVALRTMGPDFRFVTRLSSTAPIVGSVLEGDLALRGSADPSLTRADLVDLARQLRARGVETVAGSLIVDAGLFAPPTWEPGWVVDDLAEAYAAPVSGIILEGNVATGDATASGVPVADPARTAGDAMRAALTAEGIGLRGAIQVGPAAPGASSLAEHRSAPLLDLLVPMNKQSLNLYAEALFRMLGTADPVNPGSAEAGRRGMLGGLGSLGVAIDDLRVADGSGLSRYDLVTPRAIARVLVALDGSAAADRFRAGLPVAGVDGTLAHRFVTSPLRGQFEAKTGTMSGVSTLAGYLEGTHGRRWVVVLMVHGFTGPVRPVQVLEDSLVERIARVLAAQR